MKGELNMSVKRELPTTPVDPNKVRIHKVNYDALARVARRRAYRRAIANGYTEEDARKFANIWGATVEPQYRVA